MDDCLIVDDEDEIKAATATAGTKRKRDDDDADGGGEDAKEIRIGENPKRYLRAGADDDSRRRGSMHRWATGSVPDHHERIAPAIPRHPQFPVHVHVVEPSLAERRRGRDASTGATVELRPR